MPRQALPRLRLQLTERFHVQKAHTTKKQVKSSYLNVCHALQHWLANKRDWQATPKRPLELESVRRDSGVQKELRLHSHTKSAEGTMVHAQPGTIAKKEPKLPQRVPRANSRLKSVLGLNRSASIARQAGCAQHKLPLTEALAHRVECAMTVSDAMTVQLVSHAAQTVSIVRSSLMKS